MKIRQGHLSGQEYSLEQGSKSSRIPGFYRLPVEQRLAFLARSFGLSDQQVSELRNGNALRIEHAVNLVENAIGVLALPLGLGLNFLVDGRDYIIPMAIEEASIIAAASKAALIIRAGGGFKTRVDRPVMIGQIQVLDIMDIDAAIENIYKNKAEILAQANLAGPRMVARGGGVFDIETRKIDGENIGQMLIVHLLYDVREAMGANAINSACEAVGPLIQKITGGRVNLRILSNLADRRLARAEFSLSFEYLSTKDISGEQAAMRIVEASQFAWADPYRAATHNKGIFNGICAAGLALGQDWRAIEAGGHAYAARDGQYRGLTRFTIQDNKLHGEIELPLQVGWVGGITNSHPGVKTLRQISGIKKAGELAGILAAVGLAQNFAACHALGTVGIQKGHMALHARSVAISVGVPADEVEAVAQEMIQRGDVKVAAAEEIYRRMLKLPKQKIKRDDLPVEVFAPGKVILFGEHATVYNYPGITTTIDIGLTLRISRDPDGPRFVAPEYKQVFPIPSSEQDVQTFSKAVELALAMYGLEKEPIAIQVESDLVPGMGLGSSAAFSVALCSALRQYKNISSHQRHDRRLFADVQRLESIFHGTPSGMDAATVLANCVLWFRKGPPREILPIRTQTTLTGLICLVEPGAATIELVQKVRDYRYRYPAAANKILEEIGNLTVDAGIALGIGDVPELGRLMFKNHELLAKLGVSTPALDDAVGLLLDRGVLGAKLTGSGGGGAVIALVNPDTQYELVNQLTEEFASVIPFTIGANA
jgi:hydroxymethylglutaryl-CoA reductase